MRTAERVKGQMRLLLWSPAKSSEKSSSVGMVLSEDEIRALSEATIGQLVAGLDFNVALRDIGGQTFWQQTAGFFIDKPIHCGPFQGGIRGFQAPAFQPLSRSVVRWCTA